MTTEIYILIGLVAVLLASTLYYFLVIKKNETVKGITAEEFKEKLSDDVLVIDIRLRKDFKKGYIPGAKNIPFNQIQRKVKSLDNSKAVLLYSKEGLSEKRIRHFFLHAGFKEVYNLKGGLDKWPYPLHRL